MEYKGYRWNELSYSDMNRFNGIRIHILDNRNGKYCNLAYGKNCLMYVGQTELMNNILMYGVDSLVDESETTEIRLSQDWVEGFIARGNMGAE